jgi:hypothetical protein
MAKFTVEMGLPEMERLWNDLLSKAENATLAGDERLLLKKLRKTILFLAENPAHPGLSSHEIKPLSDRYGQKVWQSYLENRTPAAGRLFWTYGPRKGVITIIGLEPHPESAKSGGYDRLRLSTMRAGEGGGSEERPERSSRGKSK